MTTIDYEALAKALAYRIAVRYSKTDFHANEPLSVFVTDQVLHNTKNLTMVVSDHPAFPGGYMLELQPEAYRNKRARIDDLTNELGQVLTTLEPEELNVVAESVMQLLEKRNE